MTDTFFREPSPVSGFFDETFPGGSALASLGLNQVDAITFDLAADQTNNRIKTDGGDIHHLRTLEVGPDGQAFARWYTDFKRHDMGDAPSDPDDPLGLGTSMFLTRSLAGVGVTGPWLHDGRAPSLHEAISFHGVEAALSAANMGRLIRPDSENWSLFWKAL